MDSDLIDSNTTSSTTTGTTGAVGNRMLLVDTDSRNNVIRVNKLKLGVTRHTCSQVIGRKRIIHMLCVLVVEFFLCWTPVYVLNVWAIYKPKQIYSLLGPTSISYIHLLSYLSSCTNPITYCFMHKKFRKALMAMIRNHGSSTHRSSNSSNTTPPKPPIVKEPTLSQQWDQLSGRRSSYKLPVLSYRHQSNALRILSSVSAFIKLFESLFWLSLLLEATHNEDDQSTHTLTVILATAFIISLTTGVLATFGPCFHGLIQYKTLMMATVCAFLWDSVVLILCFILDYYKHSQNKDNQTETAFNATIGVITSVSILTINWKLVANKWYQQNWCRQQQHI
ncbi:uncharacterized protein LOC128965177 [Oppia nitens]|uniref:uncharacterized protein LOC128965177 n=1 Tax=Oppia nitens TaxID=1686743 RepID=UPI0023DC5917|nr:uncharacterized protein LOC128965177 [Oppia nitens]